MGTRVRIVKIPDLLHGKPPNRRTRIGIFQVGELVRRHDWSLEDVTSEFEVDREQTEAALDNYDEHPELVETLRVQREQGVGESSNRAAPKTDASSLRP